MQRSRIRPASPPDENGGQPIAPIFILGNHRSGTTWLYQLLTETGCFDYLAAHHIIDYAGNPADPSRESAYQKLASINTRIIDNVTITPDTPEEYCFILQNAGNVDGLTADNRLTAKNMAVFQQMCLRIQAPGASPRPLLLKNPWDYSNFLFMKQALPGSRYVFIHRHPFRVVNSYLKCVRSILEQKNDYIAILSKHYDRTFKSKFRLACARFILSPRLDSGVRVITKLVAEANEYFMKNIPALPAADYISVRYEDLCERPWDRVQDILRFLQVEHTLEPSRHTLPQARTEGLLPEVESWQERISRRMKDYMDHHAYRRDAW